MSLFNTLIPSLAHPLAAQSEDRPADLANSVKPVYDISETPDAYGVSVQLPGIGKNDLELTIEESEIRIIGRRSWKQPEGWTALYRETVDAPFELVLAHENAIESDKIVAELRDGVLRVSLPKREAIKPRKVKIG